MRGGGLEAFPKEDFRFILTTVVVTGAVFGGILGSFWKPSRSTRIDKPEDRRQKPPKSTDFLPLSKDSIGHTEGGFRVGKRLFARYEDAEEYLYHVNVQRELTRRNLEARERRAP
jgi:hypothetical protein